MTEANGGLFQSQGAPYANFLSTGTNYQGTVVGTGQVQSRKFKRENGKIVQGELEFWPDQKPKMTAIITIQTSLRDPSIEGDDGQRSLWIKGKSMTDSVKAAIRKAGAAREGIVPGGWISMTFTHETPNDPGMNPTKHYEVEYRRPAESPQDNINIVPGVSEPGDPPQAASTPYQGVIPPHETNQSQAPQSQAPGMDLSSLSPEARAAVAALLASQGAK